MACTGRRNHRDFAWELCTAHPSLAQVRRGFGHTQEANIRAEQPGHMIPPTRSGRCCRTLWFTVLLAIGALSAAFAGESRTVSPAPSPSPYREIYRIQSLPTLHMSQGSPLPTPPPDVLARTKYIFEENPMSQHWWILPSAPEERYVKTYVTSVKHVGPLTICRGWTVRVPMAGANWIVDSDASFLCAGKLHVYRPDASPSPSASSTP